VTDLAVFDFDGTLTRRDTLMPFLAAVCGRRSLAAAVARHAPVVVRGAAGWGGETVAKQALFTRLLAGRLADEVEEAAIPFANRLLARGMRADVMDRLTWHLEQGHELALVTASPELYAAPIGRRLGFTTVLGTRLEVDGAGRLTGRLVGLNVKGEEKVRRLRDALGPVELGWAYGNSRSDRHLLSLARHQTMVGKGARS
jgi:HAD superfamily hydrolase (TIGR01490 family)